MTIRRRRLSAGWYPTSATQVGARVQAFLAECPSASGAVAAVAPHAGWEYSGALAAAAVASLERGAETVVVVGGHLGPHDEPCAAFEDALETPLGPAVVDRELLDALGGRLALREDAAADNTVEVQLPLVRALLPEARVLALRAPASQRALELGEAIAVCATQVGRRVVVLGSTDLTHYGPAYGFEPRGGGGEAVRWVREVNDRGFIDAVLALDGEEALRRGLEDRSACSPGAAAVAASYARAAGARSARLLAYRTSFDVVPADSFVGYAAIVFER